MKYHFSAVIVFRSVLLTLLILFFCSYCLASQKSTSQYIDDLSSSDLAVQQAAVVELVKSGDTVIDPLLKTLDRDSDPSIAGAIDVLSQMHEKRAIIPITRLANDKKPAVRRSAVLALGNIDAASCIDVITLAASDSDPIVRENAAWALGESNSTKVVQALCVMLSDKDSFVRAKAATSLSKIGDMEAVDPLLNELKDKYDPTMRSSVIGALGKLQAKKAIEPLLEIALNFDQTERILAVDALVLIGDQVIPVAVGRLTDANCNIEYLKFLLSKFKTQSIDYLLPKLKDDDPSVRRRCVTVLSAFNNSRSTEALLGALQDVDKAVRHNALFALGEIRDPKSIAPLIDLLNNPAFIEQQELANALYRITGQEFGLDYNKWKDWLNNHKQ